MRSIWALLLAALAGATMALQGTLNSALGKSIGLWQATFVVNATGTLVALAAMLVFGRGGDLAGIGSTHPLTWFGGVLGVLIIFGVATSMPRVGVSPATTAIVSAQLLVAFAIDHFGLLGLRQIPFHAIKLLGVALIAAGAWILLRQ